MAKSDYEKIELTKESFINSIEVRDGYLTIYITEEDTVKTMRLIRVTLAYCYLSDKTLRQITEELWECAQKEIALNNKLKYIWLPIGKPIFLIPQT